MTGHSPTEHDVQDGRRRDTKLESPNSDDLRDFADALARIEGAAPSDAEIIPYVRDDSFRITIDIPAPSRLKCRADGGAVDGLLTGGTDEVCGHVADSEPLAEHQRRVPDTPSQNYDYEITD